LGTLGAKPKEESRGGALRGFIYIGKKLKLKEIESDTIAN